jgi:NAD(P)-dependent dehydrogenase (short-subunit alcohol dehydrogenase family)
MSLSGMHAVLIGGSSGIGLAVAKLLAGRQVRLTLASRSKERLDAARQRVGGDTRTDTIDTLDEASVRAFFDRIEPPDHLLCFAGDSMSGGVLTADIPAARNAMESKFWGQFYVARYGGPKVKPGGSLTLTGGSGPHPHEAVATMAANEGLGVMVRSLARELAPVRVNLVAPYFTDTPMWAGMPDGERRALYEAVGKSLPVGRVATPEEVATTYLHVVENEFFTGAHLKVNGGAELRY